MLIDMSLIVLSRLVYWILMGECRNLRSRWCYYRICLTHSRGWCAS